IPATSTIMACSTSMVAAFEAAGMLDDRTRTLALVGGVESMSHIQLGLGVNLSDWVRGFQNARSLGQKFSPAAELKYRELKPDVPSITNRMTGMSMGEHTEITAKQWNIPREAQDGFALESHQRAIAGWERGFFDDLVFPLGKATRDSIPRKDTSL